MESQHVQEYCQKCKYLREAESIQIELHEWPLPRDELQAQSTVFELDVPPSFGHWRDVTLFLRLDVMQGSYSTETVPQTDYLLQNYQGLSNYFVSFSATQHIRLLSETKPHGVTHRRSRYVTSATSEYDVCLVNGLQYAYHDSRTGFFVDSVRFCGRMETMCMYAMPPASNSLQQFLYRPAEHPSGPAPNTAIASQSACPGHFTLQEYTALCTLPLGNRIQWQNILLQLHAPAVDLKKVETLLTVLQCILQAGPRGDAPTCRESHAVMEDAQFASGLLRGLDIQLQHIKTNWQASHAINSLVCLGCRLCTLTTDSKTRALCLQFLDACRSVAMDWFSNLQEKASHATDEEVRAVHRSRGTVVAMICCATFDLDQETLASILSSLKNATILIRCAIVIREGQQSLDGSAPFIRVLQRRVQKLLHRSYSFLSTQIVQKSSGALDDAIRLSWPAYQATGSWQRLPTHDYWLTRHATNEGTADTVQMHFNLLDGDLRVDGMPLGRLPDEYERHPSYFELFGHSVIEVMPSALPGMCFAAKTTFHGHTLHFGMAGEDFLLRASNGDYCYELVPRRLLDGYYPVQTVHNYLHWYDVAGGVVEFRDRVNPWMARGTGWILAPSYGGNTWQLQQDGCLLLTVQSTTARLVSKPLEPLEEPSYMHCVLRTPSDLELQLPRLQLEFLCD